MPEKTVFGTVFGFFLGKNFFSRPLFFEFLSGSLKFSRVLFRIFSRVDFFFFLGQKFKIFLGQLFFSRAKIFQRALNFQRVKCRFKGDFWRTPTGSELCYRRDFANMERVSATGKMIISI